MTNPFFIKAYSLSLLIIRRFLHRLRLIENVDFLTLNTYLNL